MEVCLLTRATRVARLVLLRLATLLSPIHSGNCQPMGVRVVAVQKIPVKGYASCSP